MFPANATSFYTKKKLQHLQILKSDWFLELIMQTLKGGCTQPLTGSVCNSSFHCV